MIRSSTVSQIVHVFVIATALAGGSIGCGGSVDCTGAAGSGGAGTAGAAGSSGTACTLAEVNAIMNPPSTGGLYTGCTVISACHDNSGAAAGLDLTTAGWQTKLVGKGPTANAGAGPGLITLCAGMGRMYLDAGSKPATGLLIDKINPNAMAPCGLHMPDLGAMLSPTQFACFQSYLTTLTSP